MTYQPTVVLDSLTLPIAAELPRGQFVCVAGQVGRVVGILDGKACWTDGVDPAGFRAAVRAFRWRVVLALATAAIMLPAIPTARFNRRFELAQSSMRRAALAWTMLGAAACLTGGFACQPPMALLGGVAWIFGAVSYRRAVNLPPIFDLSFARM